MQEFYEATNRIGALPGPLGVAVSGGADSMALLEVAADVRCDLIVIHLNHRTRGQDSDGDAAHVADAANRLGLPAVIRSLEGTVVGNRSAFFRGRRLALFQEVCGDRGCTGVMVAHHALDQAETALLRVLRGTGPAGPFGMSDVADLHGVRLYRPFLNVLPQDVRRYLTARQVTWREDASNSTGVTARNRWRPWLRSRPELVTALLSLARQSADYRAGLVAAVPPLQPDLSCTTLASLPDPIGRFAAKAWLHKAGVPHPVDGQAVGRLLEMASDASSPRQLVYPGGVVVRRQRGIISVRKN
jgi:tRNA(Ile)-lysidine synthetase-like protein